jgi:hypothetical protein
MIAYWHSRPTRMPCGLRKAMRKSLNVSEAPMPSMMTIIMMPSSLVSNSVSTVVSVVSRVGGNLMSS